MEHRLLTLVATFTMACAAASDRDGTSGRGLGGPSDPSPSGPNATIEDGGGLNAEDAAIASPDATDPSGACASETRTAERLPLDIYVLLDQSGSMKDSKWASAKAAIKAFVTNKASEGVGVGIQYFPLPDPGTGYETCLAKCTDCTCAKTCGCSGGCSIVTSGGVTKVGCSAGGTSCRAADYASPDVAIATVPGVNSAIIASMDAHSPSGGTPTRPALEGALKYAREHNAKNPTHKVVVVLATDGVPSESECVPNTIPDVKALASSSLSATPSIPTFVIGVGGSLTQLNDIAAAGGTSKAYLVDAAGDAVAKFVEAMSDIRAASLGCEYLIPPSKDGSPLDYAKVNVTFTGKDGKTTTLPQVSGASACDATAGGWYYDDPVKPTRIRVCPASCASFNSAALGAQVSIVLGCKTVRAK